MAMWALLKWSDQHHIRLESACQFAVVEAVAVVTVGSPVVVVVVVVVVFVVVAFDPQQLGDPIRTTTLCWRGHKHM